MGNMLSLTEIQEMKKKVHDCKNLILSMQPIKEKHDYYLAGVFAINAGLFLFDDFMKLDSKNAEEFEETKKYTIEFLEGQIAKIKKAEFIKPSNVAFVNFEKTAVQHDQ